MVHLEREDASPMRKLQITILERPKTGQGDEVNLFTGFWLLVDVVVFLFLVSLIKFLRGRE